MGKKKKQNFTAKTGQNENLIKGSGKKKTPEKEKKYIPKYTRNDLLMVAIYAVVIMIVGVFLYKPVIDYNLVYCDDNIFLQDYYGLNKDTENIKEVFNKTMGTSYYRPILNVSLIVDTQLSLDKQFPGIDPNQVDPKKITPEIFHLTNLILHVFASFLVFVFLLKLGYPILTSFFFGMLMVVHPLLTPAASWISGRNDSMITVFLLLSFIFLIFYFERKSFWKFISYILHILFFGIALFTKEITAFFPFVVLAYVLLFEKRRQIFNKEYILIVLGEFVMGMIWFVMRSKAIEGIKNPDTIGIDALWDNLLSVPALIGKFFVPLKMIALSSYEWFSIGIGLFAMALIIAYVVSSKKIDKNKAYFGFLWFLLLVFPTLLIRIIYVEDFFDYAEHRAYLVMIGLIVVIIEIMKVYKIDFKKPLALIIMSLIILTFGYKSYTYRDEFQNRKTFWSHMTKMYPYKSRGYLDLGKAYLVEDSLDQAEKLYKMGIVRNPDNRNLYIDLAAVYLKKAKFDDAISQAKKALSIEPGNVIAYYNLGRAYLGKNQWKEALSAYENACKTNKYPDWFKELADAYYKVGNYEMAVQSYRKAINGNPRNVYAYTNLGLAYTALRNYKDAETSWNIAIQINPKIFESYYNIIRLSLAINKDIPKAQRFVALLQQQGGKIPNDIHNLFTANGIKI